MRWNQIREGKNEGNVGYRWFHTRIMLACDGIWWLRVRKRENVRYLKTRIMLGIRFAREPKIACKKKPWRYSDLQVAEENFLKRSRYIVWHERVDVRVKGIISCMQVKRKSSFRDRRTDIVAYRGAIWITGKLNTDGHREVTFPSNKQIRISQSSNNMIYYSMIYTI